MDTSYAKHSFGSVIVGRLSSMAALFDLLGFAEVSGLELVFLLSAMVGGSLFLVWFLLVMIGGAVGGIAEGIFDVEFGDSDLSFKSLTFQGILAFFMMFGLVGYALINSGTDDQLAALGGLGAGAFSLWIVSKMFEGFHKLETSGNIDINNAIGATGIVYARIREGGVGEVRVTFQEKLQTRKAVSVGGVALKTGDFIEVVGIVGETLQVQVIDSGTVEEE